MSSPISSVSFRPTYDSSYAIFAGSLSEKTTQASLYNYFAGFGQILGINLIVDWTTGESKRCAIVFCSCKDVFSRILSQTRHIVDEKPIRVIKAD